ncbi:nuclear transport factor 2 family protein [Microbacterium sp. Se5.02b]|nr:nuclear transport factor 2 family protein [Microbacterium sp. Se5.02b]
MNPLGELSDRQEIQELVLRYCSAVDRADYLNVRGVYARDGVDHHRLLGNGRRLRGLAPRTHGRVRRHHAHRRQPPGRAVRRPRLRRDLRHRRALGSTIDRRDPQLHERLPLPRPCAQRPRGLAHRRAHGRARMDAI